MTDPSNRPQSPTGDATADNHTPTPPPPGDSSQENGPSADPDVSRSGSPVEGSTGATGQVSAPESSPAVGQPPVPPPAGYGPGYGGTQPGPPYPPPGTGGYGNVPPPPPVPGQLPGFGGYGMLPPGAPRSSKKGWIIGLSIAAVIVVLCCGCGALGGYAVYRAIESERDRAGDVTQEYLDALREQRFDDAYELTCDRNQDDQTRQEFVTEQREAPRLREYEIEGVAISQDADTEYEVMTRQEFADGSTDTERIPVVSEGDELRPCP